MQKRTLLVLNLLVLAGAVVMIASFFLKVADITIEGQGYFATALNLARGQVERDYVTGVGGIDYYIDLRAYFPEFVGLVIFGFMTFPTVLAKKDPVPRYLGILFGMLGPVCAFYGYYHFIDTDLYYIIPEMTVSMEYGLWVSVMGGALVIAPSLAFVVLKLRESKKDTK